MLVFAVTLLVFSLLYMMPGNPIDIITDRKVSAEKRAELVHQYGYDQPLHVQYGRSFLKPFCRVRSA